MLEVEVKYRVPDHAPFLERLHALGAEPLGEHFEEDHYFNAPDRDFQHTDEAFRLRRIGSENRFTYKGPKLDTLTKTRTEIEIRLADGDATDAVRMVQALGYRFVAVVRKRRAVFRLQRGTLVLNVCLDDADGVGSFVEVEAIAEDSDAETAKAAVRGVAAELGLTEQERRSYLGMLLSKSPPVATGGLSIAATIAEVRARVGEARRRKLAVGFVPTMGALHEGHAALIRAAKAHSGFAVVSIFVNPTQFGPTEDFARYPRTLDADRALCEAAGADLIFAPTADEMYPEHSFTTVDVAKLGDHLCGASRPGHFRGVCTVVAKLFEIVQPDAAHFGAKDYQQARIIVQMARDLNVPVDVRIEPTVREADGLALSSRNRYLAPEQRAAAPGLYRALLKVRDMASRERRRPEELEAALCAELAAIPGARIDYARIVDAATLQPLTQLDRPAIAAVAVFFGTTRLIDNILVAEFGMRTAK